MKRILFFVISFVFSFLNIQAQDWVQIGQDINGSYFERFGYSVSINSDGSIVAIGAPGFDHQPGKVSIYRYNNSTWTQIGQDIVDNSTDNLIGFSVSLSSDGSIVAIGCPTEYSNQLGYVRIYENNNGTWTQLGQDIYGRVFNDFFGKSISLSADGSTVAIGAPGTYGHGNSGNYVLIYHYNNGTWTQIGQDINIDSSLYENMGSSVSLNYDGSIVAIGCKELAFSGYVLVYQNINGTWTQLSQHNIQPEGNFTDFGSNVSISSDGLILAASYESKTMVYEYISENWVKIDTGITGEGCYGMLDGGKVSLSSDGSIVAVADNQNIHNSCLHIYKNIAGSWMQLDTNICVPTNYNQVSVSLSSDGSTVAFGIYDYNNNSGKVKIFRSNLP